MGTVHGGEVGFGGDAGAVHGGVGVGAVRVNEGMYCDDA